MNGTLVLVRHGESLWNAKNTWTGLTDIGLSDTGKLEAVAVAALLKDIAFTAAFTSELSRAQETLSIIVKTLGLATLPVTRSAALNERDYGDFTGKNKSEVKALLGDSEFLRLRRGWDYPVPHGESLKQVYARVVPYYESNIAPLLASGNSILLVAHGNSLRALIKYIEKIPDEKISDVELKTGEVKKYTI